MGGFPFVASTDENPPTKVGRRAAARLRLSIPARLVTVVGTRKCVLIDVSRCGAQIALEHPLDSGDGGILSFAGFEVFGCVIRRDKGVNGLEFDPHLTEDDVLCVRRFAEKLDRDERGCLLENARAWTGGETKD
ncbi:MAG: PilZ domain-containing protein [Pseudomonadota bacterium]